MTIISHNTYSLNTDAVQTYKRILVLLDGSSAGEQAIKAAMNIAARDGGELVLICTNQPGARSYIDGQCNSLRQQRIQASGYTVRDDIADLPAWLINSEKADAIVITQKTVGWLGRLFGADIAAALQSRTKADVIKVAV